MAYIRVLGVRFLTRWILVSYKKRVKFLIQCCVKTNNWRRNACTLRIDITCDANANMLYAFNNTVLVLIEQLSECLVHKPLQAASRSADHVRDWPVVQKLNFNQDNLSAKEIITRNTSMPEVDLFNSLNGVTCSFDSGIISKNRNKIYL